MTVTPASIGSLAPMSLTVEGGSPTILATENLGITLGIMNNMHHHSGNIFQTAVVIPGADRRIRISTPFAGAFALLGLALTPITALDLFEAMFSDFNRLSGANHQKFSLAAACKAAAQITGWHVNVDGILMADIDILYISSTGVLDPLVMTPSVALPAITGSPTLHTLGPVSYGTGVIIPGTNSSSGNIGSSPTLLRVDGDFFGRTAARVMAKPIITLNHSDPKGLLDVLSILGLNLTNLIVYFKSYDATTGLSSQANGISITVAAGRVLPDGPDESQGVVSTTGVHVLGISSDGGVNPLVIATGVSVPTPP